MYLLKCFKLIGLNFFMKNLLNLNVDLHTHSTASDGVVSPSELVNRALKNNVDILALTDHDCISGLSEAYEASIGTNLKFINGVEISVSWSGLCIHLVGLAFDKENNNLLSALKSIQDGRYERAKKIDEALKKEGLPSFLDFALDSARNPGQIGRAHFARAMVKENYCSDIQDVFNRYLVKGKPGFVEHHWPSLKDGMSWIKEAGGVPVIAHPARYKLGSHLHFLLDEFADNGGDVIEVATGSHSKSDILKFQILANEYSFDASRGSDFHCPLESRCDVGFAPNLPDGVNPVWYSRLGLVL